jgi:L-aminopeptidase/D-esterase-like protein
VSDRLPGRFRVGHWSDAEGWTGCTVVLAPAGAVGACEVRGGGPGTRESDLLSPAASAPGPQAVLLTGGSAFGLAAADGAVRFLAEQGAGFRTRAGVVPLVAGAVVFDLGLGDREARPDAAAAYAACTGASTAVPQRGSLGAGTGCTVGKLLGPEHWTKGGLGYAAAGLAGGAVVAALAVVNAFGEVLAEDGSVLAGVWRAGGYRRTIELLAAGETRATPWNESTTLVCVLTDAALTKTEAWVVARAASSGVARAVDPSATAVDGDVVYCLADGRVEVDRLALAALAAEVTAAAIRDAVRSASGAPGCPSADERRSANEGR